MSIKLYEQNAYLKEFDAHIISQTKKDDLYDIILDQTALFPEEGGQTCDKGFLNDIEVIDVQIIDDKIHHYLKQEIKNPVHGRIDWTHRYSNMQNHTGEHILSGVIHHEYHLNNVGFHLGNTEITADYDGNLDNHQITYIEKTVNQIIQENHLVKTYYLDDYSNVDYRAKLDLDKPRLVEIEGIDLCACCAPHVHNTNEVGLFKIIKSMKIKKGTRLFILCGKRAIDDYILKHNEVNTISNQLSSKPYEISKNVQRILDENYKMSIEIKNLHKQLIDHKQIEFKSNHIVFEDGLDRDTQLHYFNRLLEKTKNTVLLISGNRFMTNNIEILSPFKYRGGGKNNFYQGTLETNIDEVKKQIEE